MYHFNNLTPAEAERLALVIEECSEVIHVCGKILRHGFDSVNPIVNPAHGINTLTNRERLQNEIGDLRAVIRLMINCNDILEGDIIRASQAKNKRMEPWLHHQGPLPDHWMP